MSLPFSIARLLEPTDTIISDISNEISILLQTVEDPRAVNSPGRGSKLPNHRMRSSKKGSCVFRILVEGIFPVRRAEVKMPLFLTETRLSMKYF